MHRIVNWLLTLEDRRALRARQVEHDVPHKVKLPGFWEKDSATWFKLAKVVMKDNHLGDPQVMYRTVLMHIPHHRLERARGILSLADTLVYPFIGLKNRPVELLLLPPFRSHVGRQAESIHPAVVPAGVLPRTTLYCILSL